MVYILWSRIAIRPNNFQIYFTLAFGSLSVALLTITIITWKVYPSFSVPADIMFAICCAELLENTSLVTSAIYFAANKNSALPYNFAASCTAVSVIFIIGNTASLLYNLVFCTVLTLSIRKPLKGTLFNQFRYHAIVITAVTAIVLALSLSEGVGTGLNGICGYKMQNRESFARFAV